jgi:hypothetical protein
LPLKKLKKCAYMLLDSWTKLQSLRQFDIEHRTRIWNEYLEKIRLYKFMPPTSRLVHLEWLFDSVTWGTYIWCVQNHSSIVSLHIVQTSFFRTINVDKHSYFTYIANVIIMIMFGDYAFSAFMLNVWKKR